VGEPHTRLGAGWRGAIHNYPLAQDRAISHICCRMSDTARYPLVVRPTDRARVKRGFWPKLRAVARRIPFAEDALAAYYCAFDPRTPTRVRGVLLAALAYFVVPADLIPDFLPALGFTDDAAVILAVMQMVTAHMQPRHREAAQKALAEL
jgi:uncharacterized membrane protein YkvA (DUF1232 family)